MAANLDAFAARCRQALAAVPDLSGPPAAGPPPPPARPATPPPPAARRLNGLLTLAGTPPRGNT